MFPGTVLRSFQKLFLKSPEEPHKCQIHRITGSPLQMRKVTREVQDLKPCGTLPWTGRCCISVNLRDDFGDLIHASVLLVHVIQPHLGLTACCFLVCC